MSDILYNALQWKNSVEQAKIKAKQIKSPYCVVEKQNGEYFLVIDTYLVREIKNIDIESVTIVYVDGEIKELSFL